MDKGESVVARKKHRFEIEKASLCLKKVYLDKVNKLFN
jgi:hypothetical protein